MKAFFVLLIFYLLVNVFIIALGIGIGFVLHRILPAVDIGLSILIGVVTSGISLYFGIGYTTISETTPTKHSSANNSGRSPRLPHDGSINSVNPKDEPLPTLYAGGHSLYDERTVVSLMPRQ